MSVEVAKAPLLKFVFKACMCIQQFVGLGTVRRCFGLEAVLTIGSDCLSGPLPVFSS